MVHVDVEYLFELLLIVYLLWISYTQCNNYRDNCAALVEFTGIPNLINGITEGINLFRFDFYKVGYKDEQ